MSIINGDFCDLTQVRSLRDYLLTSLGPFGTHKVFVGSTGRLNLTASSRRVLRLLELRDPCCESILHASGAFLETNQGSDGGTYHAALLCELTCLFQDFDRPEEASVVLQNVVRECFEQSKLTIDWSKAGSITTIVKTILSSKPWLSKKEITPLAVSIVKGFLNTLPGKDESPRNGFLQAKVVHGLGEESKLYPGVLHSLSEWKLPQKVSFPTRVLALKLKLKSDLSELEEMEGAMFEYDSSADKIKSGQDFIKWLIDICKAEGVKVIANQKVLAEEFIRMFHRQGIICLDRMGASGIEQLCLETGATALATTSRQVLSDALPGCLGTIQSCQQLDTCGSSYLNMVGLSKVATVMVQHWNEEVCEDLQLLCDNAILSLSSALGCPYVLPGAGCLEANLVRHLLKTIKTENRWLLQLARGLSKFCLQLSGTDLRSAFIDLNKGHLWIQKEFQDSEYVCSCGLVKVASGDSCPFYLEQLKSEDTNQEVFMSDGDLPNKNFLENVGVDDENVRVDLLNLRERQWISAVQIALNLSAVGIVIQK